MNTLFTQNSDRSQPIDVFSPGEAGEEEEEEFTLEGSVVKLEDDEEFTLEESVVGADSELSQPMLASGIGLHDGTAIYRAAVDDREFTLDESIVGADSELSTLQPGSESFFCTAEEDFSPDDAVVAVLPEPSQAGSPRNRDTIGLEDNFAALRCEERPVETRKD
eukprot:5337447-Pyramimonas_sp.AAC.1